MTQDETTQYKEEIYREIASRQKRPEQLGWNMIDNYGKSSKAAQPIKHDKTVRRVRRFFYIDMRYSNALQPWQTYRATEQEASTTYRRLAPMKRCLGGGNDSPYRSQKSSSLLAPESLFQRGGE